MSKCNDDFFDAKKDWSRVKDALLGSYLPVYFAKVIHTKKPIVYIDCFAGAGKFARGDEDGSPLIALKERRTAIAKSTYSNPKIDMYFIEPVYADVLQKLVSGDVIVRSITIPEGKALAEIKQILMSSPYLTGDIKGQYKEGEILPETYHFTRGEGRDAILEKARQAMEKELLKAYNGRVDNLPLKSADEMLILASIVEKETGLSEERAKVASVFINRLRLGMKLQTDPTVIYAVTKGEMNLNRPIYKRDLAYDSPYNTYVYEGLPPAPICSPGKAALQAVAHPDNTPYLYFVADGQTGGHRFAKTLNEHNANVAHYRGTR